MKKISICFFFVSITCFYLFYFLEYCVFTAIKLQTEYDTFEIYKVTEVDSHLNDCKIDTVSAAFENRTVG